MGFLRGRQGLGLAALLLAASAFLSRLMGLIRDKVISWQYGASDEADMYFAAFVVPDMINYLLAGAFMSITIIPLLARGFAEGENQAWRFLSCIFFWMTALAIALTLGGEIWAGRLARLTAPGFSPAQHARLAFFMRLILPAQVCFLSGASFTALLLLRRQFAVPALTPLVYNGAIILCGLTLPLLAPVEGMTGYCIGVSLGAFLGAFVLPLWIASKDGLSMRLVLWHPWIRQFLWMALPLMLGQTVVMLDEQFLRVFGSLVGEGAVSLLNYARRIAQVPVALMGQAIAAASYPFLVRLLAENEQDKFAETLRNALKAGLALIVPLAAWMAVASREIIELIFLGGSFSAADAAQCAPLAALMLAAAPVWIGYMLLSRGFYARQDTLTPAITGTIVTLACIPVYYFGAVPHGAWAIAVVSGAGLAAYLLWLVAIWARRYGGQAFGGTGRLLGSALAAALAGALASAAALHGYGSGHLPLFLDILARLALSGIVFIVCFGLLARILGGAELWPVYRKLALSRVLAKKGNLHQD